jgi:hypothetical protein
VVVGEGGERVAVGRKESLVLWTITLFDKYASFFPALPCVRASLTWMFASIFEVDKF